MLSRKKKHRSALGDFNLLETQINGNHQTFSVSAISIIKVIAIIGLTYFLWTIRYVLGILFVALVLASALDPWVDSMERWRIPRGVTIFSMYSLFFLLVGSVIYLIVPPLMTQLTDIASSLAEYGPRIDGFYQYVTQNPGASFSGEFQNALSTFNSTISSVTSGVYDALSGFFGTIIAVIFILVITFYMTIEEDGIKKFVRSIAPIEYQPYLVQKTNRIQEKMGSWLRGQLILMAIVGILAFIGLSIIGVPYALVLACIAGLLEFIPFLGPAISAVPAIFFAFTDSPWKAVAVIIFYIVLQQIENQIIVPKVMQKAVGLNPIVVLSVMLIGAQVAGLPGILLAVPATTILWIFLEDLFEHKRVLDNQLEEPTGYIKDKAA